MQTFKEYQTAALRTAPSGVGKEHDLLHACLGLVTEAGEIADAIKKHHAYGKPLDLTNLREELGDIMWYIPLMCRALGAEMDDVATINIAKLRARYPEKFDRESALNRNLEAERKILEQ